MTAVVASSLPSVTTPPKGQQPGGSTENGNAGADRFRQLLIKLTSAPAEAIGTSSPQPIPEGPMSAARVSIAWKLQLDAAAQKAAGEPASEAQSKAVSPTPQQQDGSLSAAALLEAAEATDLEVSDSLDANKGDTSEQAQSPALSNPSGQAAQNGNAAAAVAAAAVVAAEGDTVPDTPDSKAKPGNPVGATGEETRKPAAAPGTAQQITPKGEAKAPAAPGSPSRADQAFASIADGQAKARAEDLAPVKETKVTVLHSETHFAPVSQPSPALQIAEQIKTDLASAPASGTPFVERAPSYAKTSEPVLKILHIQLQPADLGAVTVRMSLKDDALELKLDVSQQGTAHLIQKDHEALSQALRSAGYLVDGVTVQVAEPDRSQMTSGQSGQQGQGAQSSPQSSGQQGSGSPQTNGGSGREQSPAQSQFGPASSARADAERPRAAANAGGVYV
ncbi:MAG: flagellar hook-length control protein FliK [Bacteroidota bacterium]